MEKKNFRYGVVANIIEYHTDENGNVYRGTKPFTTGTKVYLNGKHWNTNKRQIEVIGRNRFGRIALEWIDTWFLENLRVKRIYKPNVLKIMNYLEVVEACPWWNQTHEDRKDAIRFVEEWNNYFG
ncbi:MAG: hypothetical protein IKZ25_05305 [Clostridia bacterium]|nr:hypothetical protein [Clostridia bacterium]